MVHVFTTLQDKTRTVDFENIFSQVDYKAHLKDPSRRTLGDRELVAEIYNSSGNESSERGELDKALKNYELAIRLEAHHDRASLNILSLRTKSPPKEV